MEFLNIVLTCFQVPNIKIIFGGSLGTGLFQIIKHVGRPLKHDICYIGGIYFVGVLLQTSYRVTTAIEYRLY